MKSLFFFSGAICLPIFGQWLSSCGPSWMLSSAGGLGAGTLISLYFLWCALLVLAIINLDAGAEK